MPRSRHRGAALYVVAVALVFVALVPCTVLAQAPATRYNPDTTHWTRHVARDALWGVSEGILFAAVNQWQNEPSQWGNGGSGFGKRVASNVGEFVIQEGVTAGLSYAMEHPLDYIRCACHETSARIGWAMKNAVLDPMPDGTMAVAIPRIAGAYVGSVAQAAWRPTGNGNKSTAWVAIANGTASLALGALVNIYHEFSGKGTLF